MKRTVFLTALLWTLAAGTAWPIDQIFVPDKAYFGEIVSMSATVVTFKSTQKNAPGEFNANEIIRITYENSPSGLLDAQKRMLGGDYSGAIEALQNETTEDKRTEIADEINFCRAYCHAQLAFAGEEQPLAVAKELLEFTTKSPNSFHYYKACECLGDLLVCAERFPAALTYYTKLTQAPWPDYKMRAQVAMGRAYLAQDNAAAADKAFEEVLGNDAAGDLAEVQRTAAKIGKARCMILNNKTAPAIKNLNEIIDRLEDKNPEIAAMAYNALGTALRKSNKPNDAILAFLHVHLKYETFPDAHAEAVANLAKLFTETHNAGHARDMQNLLADRFANSRWNKPGAVK